MDILIFISAVILFVLQGIGLVSSPFLIGKPREPFTGSIVISNMIGFTLILFVCGRIFGWF